jgi:hypothetical protein
MRFREAKLIQNLICWVLGFLGSLHERGSRLELFNIIVELPPSTAKYMPVTILAGGRRSRGPTHSIRRSDL